MRTLDQANGQEWKVKIFVLRNILSNRATDTGFEERSQSDVQLGKDQGNAGPAGWWSQPNDHTHGGGDKEGQLGQCQRYLPEDDP